MIELILITVQFVQALVHVVGTHPEAEQTLPRVGFVLNFTKKYVELCRMRLKREDLKDNNPVKYLCLS